MDDAEFAPPEFSHGESYHVFCSYSSTDYQWTHTLIQQLEDRGLRVCDESNFTPGRPILENMSETIQQSQKVLLILSAEFVRGNWCLLEANMSMFRDCLQRKPIVPVLLQRDLSIPLPLAHLTYLEVHQPDFRQQLLRVLCMPNQDLQSSTVVPYQPPSLYNGKSLEPLSAVNEEQLKNHEYFKEFDCGVWSDSVPDQLSLIIQQSERYREAIEIVNTVAQTKVRFASLWKQVLVGLTAVTVVVSYYVGISLFINLPFWDNAPKELLTTTAVFLFLSAIWMIYQIYVLIKKERRRVLHELQKAIGQANSLLFEENILMGSQSNYKLLLVYVSVEDCRQELCTLSEDQEFFHKAIHECSCGYTCFLAKELLPFETASTSGHLEGGVCFCQYVINQMLMGQTRRFCCCKVQISAV